MHRVRIIKHARYVKVYPWYGGGGQNLQLHYWKYLLFLWLMKAKHSSLRMMLDFYFARWHLGFCNWSYTPTYRGFDSFFGFYTGQQDYYNRMTSGTFVHINWSMLSVYYTLADSIYSLFLPFVSVYVFVIVRPCLCICICLCLCLCLRLCYSVLVTVFVILS